MNEQENQTPAQEAPVVPTTAEINLPEFLDAARIRANIAAREAAEATTQTQAQ